MDAYGFQAPEIDSRPRLLIADDNPSVSSMLAVWFERDFELVGAASDALEAIELAANTLPDGALIDVDMPGGGGPAAVRGILKVSPDTAIVALSADESQAVVVEMLEAGAMSYRRKGDPSGLLVETVHRAIESRMSIAAASSGGGR